MIKYLIPIYLTLSACGTVPVESHATNTEKQIASEVYMLCQVDNIKSLDDGKSDPSTIAYAAAPGCRQEWNASVEAQTRGYNDDVKIAFRKEAEAKRVQVLTGLVLKVRNAN